MGRLKNGLRYYIARNESPPGKVVIRLVVKAGSALQEPDQVELAHLLEHLAFGKTKHFQSVFGYLDSLGLQRGRDLNAGTGSDHTTYWAIFPAISEKVLNRNLMVIHDFAQGIELSPAAVDRERTVVVRELSGGANQGEVLSDRYYPQILRGSPYGESLKPIRVRMENLRSFDIKSLFRFYEDWYRPDLQAMIIVGDVNVATVEQQVKRLFSDLKNPANPRPRLMFHVPLVDETHVLKIADSEISEVSMQILFKRRRKSLYTVADLKERMEEDLHTTIMRDRFQELGERYRKIYRTAGYGDERGFFPDLNVQTASFSLKKRDIKQGFRIVWRELERAARHGFTVEELDRVKRACLETSEYTRPTVSSALADYYAENFLRGNAIPGAEDARRLKENLLEKIGLSDLNARAANMINNPNRDFLMFSPPEDSLLLPNKDELLSWIGEVEKENIGMEDAIAMTDSIFLQKLSLFSGESGTPARSYRKDIDVTELWFENGVRVVLKPTEIGDRTEKDGVKLYAFRRGGAASYPRGEYISALNAANIAIHSGLAGLDGFTLAKVLEKHGVTGHPFFSLSRSGFSGQSTVGNAELLLQLMCEYFAHPVFDDDAFLDWKEERGRVIRNSRNDPQTVFRNIVDSLKGFGPLMVAGRPPFEYIDMNLARSIYRRHFVADRNLVLIIAGNFDVDNMIRLCNKYISALPKGKGDDDSEKRDYRRVARKACTSPGESIFVGRDTTRADVSLFFEGTYRFSARNNFGLSALNILLQDVLWQRLRNTEGGTYSVFVGSTYLRSERSEYSVIVSFSCFPRDVEKLVAAVKEEVGLLAIVVPKSLSNSVKIKGGVLLAGKKASPDSWVDYLSTQYEDEASPGDILKEARRWDKLSPGFLRQSIRKFIRGGCFSQFVLMPAR